MPNLLTVSIISLTTLSFLSAFPMRICVQWPNYGIRRQNFCYVDLKKSLSSQMFLYEDAVNFCRENGGFVNNSALSPADFDVLKRVRRNFSGVRHISRLSGHRSRAPGVSCSKSLTSRPGCTVVCAFKSCPVGTFGFPQCYPCRCHDVARCDVVTGLCVETNCTPGFFGPPVCRKCNCHLGTVCNKVTGECMFGCRKGWTGKSCQERKCRGEKCRRFTQLEGGNCTEGSNCTKPKCLKGFYNFPFCNMACRCLYSEFCDALDGNCGGTPCIGSKTGPRCEDEECPVMHFGVPECTRYCFCRNNQPCLTKKGLCPTGCRQGWSGETCSQRLCPEERFGYPVCNLVCSCKVQDVCNSLTGVCEVHGCADGRAHGKNCTKQIEPTKEAAVTSIYSTFSAFALVFGTVVVILAVCVQSMTHSPDPQRSRRSTLATSIGFSSSSSTSIATHRKSRVSYIQMDNRHLSISTREPPFGNSSVHATTGLSSSNAPAVFPSSCVDTKEATVA